LSKEQEKIEYSQFIGLFSQKVAETMMRKFLPLKKRSRIYHNIIAGAGIWQEILTKIVRGTQVDATLLGYKSYAPHGLCDRTPISNSKILVFKQLLKLITSLNSHEYFNPLHYEGVRGIS